jgi:hypothetical protein
LVKYLFILSGTRAKRYSEKWFRESPSFLYAYFNFLALLNQKEYLCIEVENVLFICGLTDNC